MDLNIEEQTFSPPEPPQFHPLIILVILIVGILFCSLLGGGLIYLLGYLKGINIQDILFGFDNQSPLSQRNDIRLITLINHLTTFLLPALFTGFIVYKRRWVRQLLLAKWPEGNAVLMGALFIMVSFPLAQFIYYLNQQIPLPDWAMSMESSTENLIKGILVMDSPMELVFNLFIIALIPAIGEELVFRGFLQKKLEAYFSNPILAIWVTAFIFSAIHFQLQGFFPRMFLGAILGYLLYWTNNLWVPIFAHFVNNAMQVVAQYFYGDQLEALEDAGAESFHWSLIVLSFFLVLSIGYYFNKRKEIIDY
ncbi:MAG: CPBP family intramembrane metalloprotease [Bacteroidetes bacterium]|nr:CPBP family intramembrane metalloprotease [Bacteroidota bacterium]